MSFELIVFVNFMEFIKKIMCLQKENEKNQISIWDIVYFALASQPILSYGKLQLTFCMLLCITVIKCDTCSMQRLGTRKNSVHDVNVKFSEPCPASRLARK